LISLIVSAAGEDGRKTRRFGLDESKTRNMWDLKVTRRDSLACGAQERKKGNATRSSRKGPAVQRWGGKKPCKVARNPGRKEKISFYQRFSMEIKHEMVRRDREGQMREIRMKVMINESPRKETPLGHDSISK